MKKIGILGGLAWPATVEYYKAICQLSQKYHSQFDIVGPAPMPEMCIESVNINYSYNRRGEQGNEKSWIEYDTYFNSALKRLEDNGVDFAIIASNTPHTRFNTITRDLNIPVLSIYDATANECHRQQINQFLLLGTEPTMNSKAFQDFMKSKDIDAFIPDAPELQSKVVNLISELFKGNGVNGSAELHEIVNSAYENIPHKQKIVCLACTELPLAFDRKKHLATFNENEVFYLNTTIIHSEAAFQYAVQ